jgi:hypothetical protein
MCSYPERSRGFDIDIYNRLSYSRNGITASFSLWPHQELILQSHLDVIHRMLYTVLNWKPNNRIKL